jgi:hypothetical protein
METLTLTQAQIDLLNRPLPAEAVTPHPTKKFLSSIKSIYVTERLNDVFGVGRWRIKSEVVENHDKMVVVKAIFTVPSYGIEYECYGGNDNADRGDAYKGATTDALTKIGSWLGIGADVFKGLHDKTAKPTTTAQQPKPRKAVTAIELDNEKTCNALLSWAYAAKNAHPDQSFNAGEYLAKHYDVTEQIRKRFDALFSSYSQAILNKK